MGQLVDGVWQDIWYDTKSTGGRFKRSTAQFRNWVTADGQPGEHGVGGFRAEAGRYHLYVSLACPRAHRTLLMRKLKGLEQIIPVSVVHPLMLENGWTFGGIFLKPPAIRCITPTSCIRSTCRPIRTTAGA